jgi:hypothetical protein
MRCGIRLIFQHGSSVLSVGDVANDQTCCKGTHSEAKELIAGYTLIQANSREEAIERSTSPNPIGEGAEAEIAVPQLYEPTTSVPTMPLNDFAR